MVKSILKGCLILLTLPCFARTPKTFPATHDSIPAENRRADMLGLKRYETLAQVSRDVESGVLVPVTIPVCSKLPKERRYALPSTVAFAEKLNADFYEATGTSLVIDSAIRPSDVQKRLRRHDRNAAPALGARASTHERGTTFDLSRRMRPSQYRWLLVRLAYYKARREILVIEERNCLHVFVNQGSFEVVPITEDEPLDTGLAYGVDAGENPCRTVQP